MDVAEGMDREAREVQPRNAEFPMDVTEDGIVTEEREVHL